MLIDDKDLTPMQAHYTFWPRAFRPVHERLRIHVLSIDGRENPLWQWRGSMFAHNKRKAVVVSQLDRGGKWPFR